MEDFQNFPNSQDAAFRAVTGAKFKNAEMAIAIMPKVERDDVGNLFWNLGQGSEFALIGINLIDARSVLIQFLAHLDVQIKKAEGG